ncbi:MAG: hypothetical protein HKM23_00450 [Nitrosopumilus sp.]|nr:hypothetical protein [Nitrosopumilus sp.]NNL58817.1 hypothetical protein [Nitrosopumilus sp.]
MDELYRNLTQVDIKSSLQVYEKCKKTFDYSDFIDIIFKPTMSKIQDDLTNEKISVVKEYVAKNVAVTLAKIIADKQNKDNS